ncbi:MAG: hypothetical protein ACK46Q_04965 [Hyphomonas sp.]
MSNRNHYLPRRATLDAMSDHDRAMVLDVHLRDLEAEIAGLKSGEITAWKGGREHQLKLSRARLRRLTKTANDYGMWLEEVAA